ncbi:spore germination protein [Paenibacillus sp. OK003]|uniref:spore germination protein n=1 Tax=Paenibacillus sp. OK003 TaxID=1884380 RepID=UPI0008BA32D9|nr:spore germination protein [Paenibacillus sp. OK003]SEL14371.1 spore germination protein KA [Paenibacillus sp. OK003]
MSTASQSSQDQRISPNLKENIDYCNKVMGNSKDLMVRPLQCLHKWPSVMLYIDGMVDVQIINHSILESLLQTREIPEFSEDNEHLIYLQNDVLTASNVILINEMKDVLDALLAGFAVVLLEGSNQGLKIAAAGWEDRAVGEPISQTVVRGPMEGFNENLRTNTGLIRKRIRDPHLWIEEREIGRVTNTRIAVVYLEHIVDQEVVKELRRRLDEIDIDAILESGYIEELVQDKTGTIFPTVYNSERPDTVCAALLEGRVAIIVDGTPFVLLVPALFVHFFQSPEDYYQRADISSLIRMIRYLAFFIALLAPSFYIAITTFHQEMLPTNLLISLAAQREGVPFPAFIEAILMELTYEILREAGIRIPKTVGQAVSIVGTLVIGQAAVDAGVVSAAMVIIVSITAISSYVIPENGLSISVRILRFVLMILAAAFGFYGILMVLLITVTHLCSLRSFGVSYMSPFAPYIGKDLKDTIFRLPWTRMKTRPLSTGTANETRQANKKTKR